MGSAFNGTIGAPAVFARSDLSALGELRGDRGAGRLLAGAPAVEWPKGAIDIDTGQDVSAAEALGVSMNARRGGGTCRRPG